MEGEAYTLARWLVQEGREDEFIRQWTERLAPTIQGLVPSARGTLVRSVENRLLFDSFGPWKDVDEASTVRTGESVDEGYRRDPEVVRGGNSGGIRDHRGDRLAPL